MATSGRHCHLPARGTRGGLAVAALLMTGHRGYVQPRISQGKSVFPEDPTDLLNPSPTSQGLSCGRSVLLPYLHPNGRPPLPLPRQAPQLLPAGNGLDDECGGLRAGPGRHRRQLQGARAHGRAVQPVRGAAAPSRALGCGEALVGGVGAALGGDGDAGRGLAPRRDGGRGLSEVEGWSQERRDPADEKRAQPDLPPAAPHPHVVPEDRALTRTPRDATDRVRGCSPHHPAQRGEQSAQGHTARLWGAART